MGFNHRRKARILLCQALYQYAMTSANTQHIMAQFLHDNADKKYDEAYFCEHYPKLFAEITLLDQHIERVLHDKKMTDLTPMELSVCRLGVYELLYVTDVPYKVVIAEALTIQKRFGSEDGHKFVNGVLDCLAKHMRPNECSA